MDIPVKVFVDMLNPDIKGPTRRLQPRRYFVDIDETINVYIELVRSVLECTTASIYSEC